MQTLPEHRPLHEASIMLYMNLTPLADSCAWYLAFFNLQLYIVTTSSSFFMLRTVLQFSIFVVLCAHVVLLYAGYIPTSAAICGMVMQLVYYQNLIDFPAVHFKSSRFVMTGGVAPNRLSPAMIWTRFNYVSVS